MHAAWAPRGAGYGSGRAQTEATRTQSTSISYLLPSGTRTSTKSRSLPYLVLASDEQHDDARSRDRADDQDLAAICALPLTMSSDDQQPEEGLRVRAGATVRSMNSIFENGVGLAPVIGTVREAINDNVIGNAEALQTGLTSRVRSVARAGSANFEVIKPQIRSLQEMANKHPSMLLGATLVCVGAPSLLISKRAAVLNSLCAVAGGYGALLMSKRLD